MEIEVIDLTTMEGNRASERVAEKCGFRLVEQVSGYEPIVARDRDVSYDVKRWIREKGRS